MPTFTAAAAGAFAGLDALHEALVAEPAVNAAWRDGEAVRFDAVRVAVALPGPVFPVLGDYAALRARDPGSFTAPELAGATFTVWGLDLELDWLTPPPLPRQGAGLGVGRAGVTLVCDARVVDVDVAARFLARLV